MRRSNPPRDALGRHITVSHPLAELDRERQFVYVHCDDFHCTFGQSYTIPELMDLFGPDVTSQDIMWTHICARCGRLPGGVKLITK